MRLVGALNVGDAPTAAELQDGLEALNAMVDAWANQRLLIYTTQRLLFGLNSGQQSYEIGPNAVDWVTARPDYLEGAGLVYGVGGVNFERPVEIYTWDEWQNQRSKQLSTSVVTALIYDYGFSNPNSSATDTGSGTVFVWPVPNATGLLALYLPLAVQQFTSANQTVSLPPGYRRALQYNLAVEFSPEFDTEPSPVVLAIAESSLDYIKRNNVRLNALRCDPGMARHQRGGQAFNLYVGE
jgi:hypothetical protein